ncbi:MAG: hypothetical protein IPN16_19020 [Gemmatimonadetes bacterium]|nr:hypothetical protein [Gemmatimonadota bacterium]
MDHHERHPYAVLVALFFLPMKACDDAGTDKSSFAHAIMTFRSRAGREEPSDPHQKFERFFVALYEHEGDRRGDVWFFDVMDKPPRRGRPPRIDPPKDETRRGLLTLDEMIREIVKAYGIRKPPLHRVGGRRSERRRLACEAPSDTDGEAADEEGDAE